MTFINNGRGTDAWSARDYSCSRLSMVIMSKRKSYSLTLKLKAVETAEKTSKENGKLK